MIRNIIFAVLVFTLTVACSENADKNTNPKSNDSSSSASLDTKSKQPSNKNKVEKTASKHPLSFRNWTEIKESKVLNVAKLSWESTASLPRSGTSSDVHFKLLEEFAAQNDLSINWQQSRNLAELLALLKNNKIDLLPRHLTITQERQKQYDFAYPILVDSEVLIGKKDASELEKEQVIAVHLPEATSHIESVQRQFPQWKINVFSEALNSEDIADRIVAGEFEYSVLDGRSAHALAAYRDDIKLVKVLPQNQHFSWALAKGNQSLKRQLDNFVAKHQIDLSKGATRQLDFSKIKEEGLPLRVITRNSPETYFLWKGELLGFEYELMEEFGKQQKINIEYIVADSFDEMIELLNEGKGDIIAAGLSRTQERLNDYTFSIRYKRVSELLIAHKESQPISDLRGLKNRTISVRKSSAFWKKASELAEKYQAKLVAADEKLSTELLIEKVANKEIDLTIADSNLYGIEQSFREEITSPLTLNDNVPYAYILRKNNPQLLSKINAYIRKIYRKTFYNVVKNKYFSNTSRKEKHRESRLIQGSALSPYDSLVKENADKYKFDWRLITSQMYQESRFNPKARSNAGALGLMQVLPKTANELGYQDLTDPKASIAAGVAYLNWTRDRFPESMPVQERLFFALAAYNAGFGHVRDAQRLARRMGLDDQKWFNNVEKAMLLLQRPEYYKKARFGYCRGSEPVNYVREINQRYLSYIDILK